MSQVAPPIAAIQLALRFGLEVAALVALGDWGRTGISASAALSWLAFLAPPCAAVAVWGTFAVPGDPSRSGSALVPVPGWLRLGIELLVLGGGALALAALQRWIWFGIFLTAFVVHHAFTISRIRWLLRQ